MSTQIAPDGSGYKGFTVEVRPSREFQGAGVTLHYEFGTPVDKTDVIEPYARAAEFAEELAGQQLDQLVDAAAAKKRGEVERQRKPAAPPTQGVPDPTPSGEIDWRQASKPGNKGTFRFRSTSDLSMDALKEMILAEVAKTGADPSLHQVWDNRPKLEETGTGYSFVQVRPTDENPAAPFHRNQKGYTKDSAFVDFNDDGTIRVTISNKYQEAVKSAQIAAEQAQNTASVPAQSDDDSLPF